MNRKYRDSGGTDQRRKKNTRANLLDGNHKRTSRLRRKNYIQRYTPSYMQRRCALRVPCLFAGPRYGRGLTMCATPTENCDIISASNVGFCSSSSILGTPLPFRYVPTHLLTPEVLTRLLVSQCRRVLSTCAFPERLCCGHNQQAKNGIDRATYHTYSRSP
jgi:hypothetical protein